MRPQKAGWISLPSESQVFATEQQPDCEDRGVFGAKPAQAGHTHAHKQLHPGANSQNKQLSLCFQRTYSMFFSSFTLKIKSLGNLG